MYRLLIIWIGKSILGVAQWRGGGSALPGLVVEKLYPDFIATLRESFSQVVLVAGTNGKTTTSKMLREVLLANGSSVLHNRAGSNMPRGIISSALEAMDWHGNLSRDFGLFEVDEGFLPQLAMVLEPEIIVILNLHRDQLDRYGELDRILQILASASKHAEKVIINRDDSKLVELDKVLPGKALWFGGADSVASQMPSDDLLHSGSSQKTPHDLPGTTVEIKSVNMETDGQTAKLVVGNTTMEVKMRMKGVFNSYNAAAALTAVYALEQDLETAKAALSKVKPAFGRSELITLSGGKKIQLLLVKNPSGFNHTIHSYLADPSDNPVLILINDNHADGRDVSWLWDVNIEALSGSKKRFSTGGLRGSEMQLRLGYADLESENFVDVDDALEDLIEGLPPGGTGYIVPTYTAMLDIRRRLHQYSDDIEEWR